MELLKTFDEDRNPIGVASREEVHQQGLWHETFQCWFIGKEEGANYIYLQLRSESKKGHPNLFDITAAGHLQAHETMEDGIREIKEELGVDIHFHDLASLGIIETVIVSENTIDREFAHVFLFKTDNPLPNFTLQEEEVSGIVKIDFNEFAELWLGKRDTVQINGFQIKSDGNKILIDEEVGRERFVPHPVSYYETVIQRIKETALGC